MTRPSGTGLQRDAVGLMSVLFMSGYFMVRDRSRIAETRRVFTEQTPDERREAA